MKKTTVLKVRITPAEKTKLRTTAQSNKISMSEIIRRKISEL